MQQLLMIYVLAGYADSAQNVMGSTLRGLGILAVQSSLQFLSLVKGSGIFMALSCGFGV